MPGSAAGPLMCQRTTSSPGPTWLSTSRSYSLGSGCTGSWNSISSNELGADIRSAQAPVLRLRARPPLPRLSSHGLRRESSARCANPLHRALPSCRLGARRAPPGKEWAAQGKASSRTNMADNTLATRLAAICEAR